MMLDKHSTPALYDLFSNVHMISEIFDIFSFALLNV